tara:strand:+ start:58 stop:192 length:135 start_codon:yes stop_codon:yes gene_type:complete
MSRAQRQEEESGMLKTNAQKEELRKARKRVVRKGERRKILIYKY